MQFKAMKFITFALLGSYYAVFSLAAAQDIKYAAIQKEGDKWKVVSVSDNVPTYQEGMEVLSLPQFAPQFDNRFKTVRSQFGGIECPSIPDKTIYTPCNSYFFKFVGANWFGLGGIRVGFVQERLAEVKNAILADETVAEIQAKADEEAAKKNQARLEADKVRIESEQAQKAKRLEAEKEVAEKRKALLADNLQKMARMERGLEDSCKRTIKEKYTYSKAPENTEIKCEFGGEVTLEGLPKAGWLVINKTKDGDGTVTEYYIRKAR